LSDLRLSGSTIPTDGTLKVSVEVQNAGSRAGDEVVQLYIRDLVSSVTRAVLELKGFSRVTLDAGERRRVEFTLGPEQLGYYGRDMKWVVEPGQFLVQIGTSSAEGLKAQFEVTGS
jgi:beta-glucosidase